MQQDGARIAVGVTARQPGSGGAGRGSPAVGDVGPGEATSLRRGVEDEEHFNEVLLVGRITSEAVFREIPSGDWLASWRICVSRSPVDGFPGRRSDSIYCVSFDPGLHTEVREWRSGDVVRVMGGLRRRAWQGRSGVRITYEVEAGAVELVRRHDPVGESVAALGDGGPVASAVPFAVSFGERDGR
ncbi:single-stranded DNA-binding protein [Nocardiopsis sp. N85]|uniref:single-stranded DNA-binding protein n=1 Tax=Nocardiopsis sp. N85 TaxID=3029400 RepID=UPI00237F1CC2|nr:single-stranded DNA-binding protein [Nocardiopsis sp. N85]MDE3723775.1 single-stranded DNA-binding protein [Nocardiopsis sp. N85]